MTDPLLTLAEAAAILDPPVSVTQLRLLTEALGIEPLAVRRSGTRGRPPSCYRASDLMRLHAAVIPLMACRQGVNAGPMTPAKGSP